MSDATPIIRLEDIHRVFVTSGGVEVPALRGISFDVHVGEFVAIMGQSGCGKTTLMNIIGCLDRPTRGTYEFAGRNIESFSPDELAWLRREAFGFIFQSYNLLANATAEENVEIPAIYAGTTLEQRRRRATDLLTSLGLEDRMAHRPGQLSGGQQQRVSIARALMNGGLVILADEPTGALDSQSSAEVMVLLKKLANDGHTVILITHDPDVARHAERLIEVLDGKLVRDSGALVRADASSIPDLQALAKPQPTMSLANLGESLRMAFRSLRANIFRTVLTLLGIVIGVASVVAMLAIGQGAQQSVIERISSLGADMLTVRPSFNNFAGQRGGASSSLTFDDSDAIAADVPNVSATLPEIQGTFTVRAGDLDDQTTVTGTTANLPETRAWPVARGVFFTDQDNNEYTPVAVLGSTVVRNLFANGADPLGRYILIKNVPFEVIGVLTSKGSSGFGGRDQDDAVFVPLKTAGLRLFGQTYVRSITVAVKDPALINQTEDQLVSFLKSRHGTEDFRIFNSAELMQAASSSQQTFTVLLGSVAAISLLVGGIGVMNIMLVSVTERTREIGIRMATGARQGDILQQFLTEALVVSAVGGVIGVVLGITIGQLITLLGTRVVFTVGPMLMAFGCAAATGLIFGYAPARKAARLDPVVALSSE